MGAGLPLVCVGLQAALKVSKEESVFLEGGAHATHSMQMMPGGWIMT